MKGISKCLKYQKCKRENLYSMNSGFEELNFMLFNSKLRIKVVLFIIQ